jgi:hypothetical protein
LSAVQIWFENEPLCFEMKNLVENSKTFQLSLCGPNWFRPISSPAKLFLCPFSWFFYRASPPNISALKPFRAQLYPSFHLESNSHRHWSKSPPRLRRATPAASTPEPHHLLFIFHTPSLLLFLTEGAVLRAHRRPNPSIAPPVEAHGENRIDPLSSFLQPRWGLEYKIGCPAQLRWERRPPMPLQSMGPWS